MTSQSQTSENQAYLGMRIKAIRQEQNLTLSDVAGRAELSASHLSQIERDKVAPSLLTLASIATALDVNIRDLFEGDKDLVYTGPSHDENTPTGDRSTLTSPDGMWNLEVEKWILRPHATPIQFASYPGEVLGYVLEGALEVYTDDEHFILTAGDSIHYDTNRLYCLRCRGDEPSTILLCHSPPRGRDPVQCTTLIEDKASTHDYQISD